MKRFLLTITYVMAFACCALAQFSGAGSGTKDDPYRIFNADQLNQVRNFLGKADVYFSLEADIDMSEWIKENNPVQGWMPIGNSFDTEDSFNGVFNGNGHVISSLMINRPETDYVGLFGCIYYEGDVRNLVIMNASYVGRDYVGGIAGMGNFHKRFESCSFYGELKGRNRIGGICGNGSAAKCYSYCKVVGEDYCGGIVGKAWYSGDVAVINSYSGGIIIGNMYVGGIAGYSEIDKCLSMCRLVNGKQGVGGMAGFTYYSFATNSIAINDEISSQTNISRIGWNDSENCYSWLKTKIVLNDEIQPTPEDSPENGTNVGLSTLKLKATYQGLDWDFDNVWEIQETECFPYLKTQTAPPYFTQSLKAGDTHLEGQCVENGKIIVYVSGKPYTTTATNNQWSVEVEPLTGGDDVEIIAHAEGKTPSYVVTADVEFAGEGTEESPYLITSAKDLQKATSDAYYKLTTDIDLSDWIAENNDGNGWIPVGGYGPAIMSRIDGDGHKITNLVCDPSYENVGLIAKIAKSGYIKNLTVETADDAEYMGEANVSVIVGYNKGTVEGCNASADILGGVNVGGIAGQNDGSVVDCSFIGAIDGGTFTGGIVGLSNGNILKCYTEGSVSNANAKSYSGGVCGNIASGELSDSYSTMTIKATGDASYGAGVVGLNSGSVLRCYASGDINGYNVSGIVAYDDGENAIVSGCVALNKNINATKTGLRVLGGLSSGSKVPGMDNYALSTMIVSVNGRPQTIYDDPMNGKAKDDDELKQSSAYGSLNWDMTDVWKIDEGYSYPYLPKFNVPALSIELDKTEVELEVGGTLELFAKVLPVNARNSNVVWSSDNNNIATVSDDGVVKALNEGSSVITVTTTDGTELSASCVIKVVIPSGIDNVQISGVEDVVEVARYSVDGRRLSAPQRGLNIVVMSDGSKRKVMVK